MRQIVLCSIPERYLIELGEAVVQGYGPNRAECIRLFIRDHFEYFEQFYGDVLSHTLPEGKPKSKIIPFHSSQQMRDELHRVVESDYEKNIPRFIRAAVRLYSIEGYKRAIKSGKNDSSLKFHFNIIFPIRTVDTLDELIRDGLYESRSQVIRNSLATYLEDIAPYTEMNYPPERKSATVKLPLGQIKMLDWLGKQGYILNRNEGVIGAINDGLLEMKGITLRKFYPIPIKPIKLNKKIIELLENKSRSLTDIFSNLGVYELGGRQRRKLKKKIEKEIESLSKKGTIDFCMGEFSLTSE